MRKPGGEKFTVSGGEGIKFILESTFTQNLRMLILTGVFRSAGPGRWFPQKGQDQGIAKERNLGAALFDGELMGHRIDLLRFRVEPSIAVNWSQRESKPLLVSSR